MNEGHARIAAPLPEGSDNLLYVDLFVRTDPNPTFTNPHRVIPEDILGGGGLVHIAGNNLYFFNSRWLDMVDYSRRQSRFYLFGVRDLALNRAVILARFEIDATPFIRADKHVRKALDDVEHMIANPIQSCSAVDDLPPEPIIIY